MSTWQSLRVVTKWNKSQWRTEVLMIGQTRRSRAFSRCSAPVSQGQGQSKVWGQWQGTDLPFFLLEKRIVGTSRANNKRPHTAGENRTQTKLWPCHKRRPEKKCRRNNYSENIRGEQKLCQKSSLFEGPLLAAAFFVSFTGEAFERKYSSRS